MRNPVRLLAVFSAVLLAVHLSDSEGLASQQEKPSAGQASGSFSVDGKPVSLHYAYAMIQADTFDEKAINTAILLTEKPIPDAALVGVKDLEDAGRGQTNWLLLKLDENGRPIREVVRHEALGDTSLQMSGTTPSDFQLAARTKERIEGSLVTEDDEEFLRHKYKTDIRFHAVLREAKRPDPLPDAKTGQKLPPGGGEPGKAFLKFHQAVQKKDLATIRKLKPADMPDMSDQDLRDALDLIAAMSPAKLTIEDGYVKGDAAVLYVTGFEDGQKRYATVEMTRAKGQWLASNQQWSDKPPVK